MGIATSLDGLDVPGNGHKPGVNAGKSRLVKIRNKSEAPITDRSVRREARREGAGALLSGGGVVPREDQLVDWVLRSDRLEIRNERIEALDAGETGDEQLEELVDLDAMLWDRSPDLLSRRLDGRLSQVADDGNWEEADGMNREVLSTKGRKRRGKWCDGTCWRTT